MPNRRTRLLVPVLATAGIVAAISQTMVTPLVPQLPTIFATSASNAAWIITATLLAGAVAVPIAGRLGDLFGKRLMLLVSFVPLIVGSVTCATAPTVEWMIAGRAVQGLCVGIIPLGIALLRDVLPSHRLSAAIAAVSASLGVGGAIGLPASAAVIEFADWRFLFWGGAALALLVAVAMAVIAPRTPISTADRRFDGIGAVGLAAGLISLLLAVSKGADWGWASPLTLGLFVAAAVVFGAWGWWELRTPSPLVDLRTTARPRVLMTNIASIFIGFGMYASMLVMPQVLQLPAETGYGLGQSVLAAGLWMAPAGLMMLILSPVSGRLSDRRGPKFTLTVGAVILASGYGVGLVGMGSTWGILATALVINAGVAFAYGAMPAIIMGSVPRGETGAANGFNTLMRSLGTSVGAAVIGVLLANLSLPVGTGTVPSETGFRVAFIVGGGLALVAAVLAALIPRRRPDAIATEATDPIATDTIATGQRHAEGDHQRDHVEAVTVSAAASSVDERVPSR